MDRQVNKENQFKQEGSKYVIPQLRNMSSPKEVKLSPLQKTPNKTSRFAFAQKTPNFRSARKPLSSMKSPFTTNSSYLSEVSVESTEDTTGPFLRTNDEFIMFERMALGNGTKTNDIQNLDSTAFMLKNHGTMSFTEEQEFEQELSSHLDALSKCLSDEKPWIERLNSLSDLYKITFETPKELIAKLVIHHHQHVICNRWSYNQKINKLAKLMITFLNEITESKPAAEWDKELISQILFAKVMYSRHLGQKWIRRLWRNTECTLQDIGLVNQPGNYVYVMFNLSTKRLFINYIQGGSLVDAFIEQVMNTEAHEEIYEAAGHFDEEKDNKKNPYLYLNKINAKQWIIMPLDILNDEEAGYIEHRYKQRVHESRHRVIDISIFFKKGIRKPPKKMSEKRYQRFLDLRERQKEKRKSSLGTPATPKASDDDLLGDLPTHRVLTPKMNSNKVAEPFSPDFKRGNLNISIPHESFIAEDDQENSSAYESMTESPYSKKQTPKTPGHDFLRRRVLSKSGSINRGGLREALGQLSPAVINRT